MNGECKRTQPSHIPPTISSMKAAILKAPRCIEVRSVPKPVLTEPHEVLVKVSLAGLCGSDLHPYRGAEVGCDLDATIMGHECVK